MMTRVLYSDDVYSWVAWDDLGDRWERFEGSGFYRFECSGCGKVKESGWIKTKPYDRVQEVCHECLMVVYDFAKVVIGVGSPL